MAAGGNASPDYYQMSTDAYQHAHPMPATVKHIATPAEQMQRQLVNNAKQFRSNIPQLQQQLGQQFRVDANSQMNQGIHNIEQNNSNRGLLYGGLNQGQEAQQRARTQVAVAGGIKGINNDLYQAANTLDAQAVGNGVGVQQTQQAIANDAYSRAMTQMNAEDSMVGNAAGTGLLAYMLL
jgi:hypothetical protein